MLVLSRRKGCSVIRYPWSLVGQMFVVRFEQSTTHQESTGRCLPKVDHDAAHFASTVFSGAMVLVVLHGDRNGSHQLAIRSSLLLCYRCL